MSDDQPPRVAVYTRVSTEDQAKEGFSLTNQLERLRAYCGARGWVVAEEYIEDGHSGRSVNRPAYQRMMDEKDRWDILLVLKMDRIHRNSKNFMEMMDRLKSWGKEFNSMSESLDTSTAMGRFVMDIIQRIAQLESEQIGERVFWGMEQKAKDGAGVLGFGQVYGYRYEDGVFHIEEEEAQAVRHVFERYNQGVSVHQIAKELEEGGAPTKRGGKWSRQHVLNMLGNPVYCGYLKWQDHVYPNGHAAIVDVAAFNAAQRRRYKRSTRKRLDNAPVELPALASAD